MRGSEDIRVVPYRFVYVGAGFKLRHFLDYNFTRLEEINDNEYSQRAARSDDFLGLR